MEKPAVVYKFMPASKFERVADVILNRRFHAAQFFNLNDPMEGLFEYSTQGKAEYIEEIVKAKKALRICSFSRSSENILMWAHYADGFKGVCFEAKINWSVHRYEGCIIDYDREHPHCSGFAIKLPGFLIARGAFLRKNKAWKYEEEIRLFSAQEFIVRGIEITGVILGLKISDPLKQSILKIIAGTQINAWDSKVDEDHNKIVKAERVS